MAAQQQPPYIPQSLEDARVGQVPPSIYYVPNFITAGEESLLRDKIEHAPASHWTHLSHRRLLSYPSALTPNNTLLAAPLPPWLMEPIVPRLQQLRRSLVDHPDGSSTPVFATSPHGAPNHVLINEYQPGQGIMPHEDGAAYFPLVATVSLGGPLVLDLYEKTVEGKREAHPRYRILQEARSLLITTDEMYTAHLHGIADIVVDEHLGPSTIANWDQLGNATIFGRGKLERVTRTSLTYRDVRKVSNLGSKLNLLSKSKR